MGRPISKSKTKNIISFFHRKKNQNKTKQNKRERNKLRKILSENSENFFSDSSYSS
jgi:hypothetical protein